MNRLRPLNPVVSILTGPVFLRPTTLTEGQFSMAKPKDETAATPAPATGAWAPPKDAPTVELSEFVKWEKPGDVIIGKITGVRERPDDQHPGKIMRSVILSPCVVMPGGLQEKATGYHSLALGLSAHLGLLITNPAEEIGQAYAVQYVEDRAPAKRGQRPSRQFSVYPLTEPQFRVEMEKLTNADDLPF